MHYVLLTLLLCLHLPFTAFAQQDVESSPRKKTSYKKYLREVTRQQINQLHDGALLVRLKTRRSSIAALRKIGKDAKADLVEMQQADHNMQIVKGFRDFFNFCPTYFYFSDYSRQVREKNFDEIIFLNDTLQPDLTIKFSGMDFLTAEFGIIEADTAKYFDGYYSQEGPKGPERKTQYTGGTNMSFGALIIKTDQFVQLKRPFPFYVRTFDSLPFGRSPDLVIEKMNRKLHDFYRRGN